MSLTSVDDGESIRPRIMASGEADRNKMGVVGSRGRPGLGGDGVK